MRVLLLGGTTEASQLAERLKAAGVDTVFSYAGRTKAPILQPLPTRVGGFGGTDGLRDYLRTEGITHVVDATHPFAAQMSMNAHTACQTMSIPLMRLERPAWVRQSGDNWIETDSIEGVLDVLPEQPAHVFLAIGRQHIDIFAAKPQHHYLLRLIDTPDAALPLPHHTVLKARGPFTAKDDTILMQTHHITHAVAKNAGGTATVAKLEAARSLGLPVIMIRRPQLPGTTVAPDIETVLCWLGHGALRGV
ncbi:cobalt-precorrin-6A reductase [Sulfitobacter sp. SK012]|uniref:cobalt-precorrin-6A reductase n=1 Tax=Sulfitobacter sp. SK012 TaxID=1389005 RepID=UPI000E0C3D93|nr:cobalt-precorrin-6A reductase [Sulfitobacter sp. SK012]AXI44812.1 cobalt-precorrin-6A reductase [Sulfitobacter sp. SK012]